MRDLLVKTRQMAAYRDIDQATADQIVALRRDMDKLNKELGK